MDIPTLDKGLELKKQIESVKLELEKLKDIRKTIKKDETTIAMKIEDTERIVWVFKETMYKDLLTTAFKQSVKRLKAEKRRLEKEFQEL